MSIFLKENANNQRSEDPSESEVTLTTDEDAGISELVEKLTIEHKLKENELKEIIKVRDRQIFEHKQRAEELITEIESKNLEILSLLNQLKDTNEEEEKKDYNQSSFDDMDTDANELTHSKKLHHHIMKTQSFDKNLLYDLKLTEKENVKTLENTSEALFPPIKRLEIKSPSSKLYMNLENLFKNLFSCSSLKFGVSTIHH